MSLLEERGIIPLRELWPCFFILNDSSFDFNAGNISSILLCHGVYNAVCALLLTALTISLSPRQHLKSIFHKSRGSCSQQLSQGSHRPSIQLEGSCNKCFLRPSLTSPWLDWLYRIHMNISKHVAAASTSVPTIRNLVTKLEAKIRLLTAEAYF